MRQPFDKRPTYGGELALKDVEKILQSVGNTAAVKVQARVCLHCGERFYDEQTVPRFDDIRRRSSFAAKRGFAE